MEQSLTVTQARRQLLHITKRFAGGKSRQAISVTRRGKPVLALVPWELYDSLLETLDVVSDHELKHRLARSLREAEAGKTISLAKLRKELHA